MSRALIIVDVQLDFCSGGVLAVPGGVEVAERINSVTGEYDHVVATRDYHIDPGEHFSDNPDFRTTWPPHCQAGTAGAAFHPALDVGPVEAVFSKGQYSAGYSGFEGVEPGGKNLGDWLRDRGVTEVDVVGIATEHCVRATAIDAAKAGFGTSVRTELVAGLAPDTVRAALDELREGGVTVR